MVRGLAMAMDMDVGVGLSPGVMAARRVAERRAERVNMIVLGRRGEMSLERCFA